MARVALGVVGARPNVLRALTELMAESRLGNIRIPWILCNTELTFIDEVTKYQAKKLGSKILPVSEARKMVPKSGLDGVLMCGMINNSLALSFLSSGVSVFCESPPSLQSADLLEFHDVASSNGARLIPCLSRRYDAGFRRLKAEYESNAELLGEMRDIHVSVTCNESDPTLRSHGFFQRHMLPDIDLVRWTSGHCSPLSVRALACPVQTPPQSLHSPFLDSALAQLEFDSGLQGSVAVSLNTLGCDHRIEVQYQNGSLILEHNPSDKACLLLRINGETNIQCQVPVSWNRRKVDSLKEAVSHFVAMLRGSDHSIFNLEDVLSAVRVTEACSVSYRLNKEVIVAGQKSSREFSMSN